MLKSKIDLFAQGWIDIVFEGKNKKYGAYHLRSRESKTTVRAMIIGVILFVSLVSLPLVVNQLEGVFKKEKPVIIDEQVTIVTLPEAEERPDLKEIAPPKQEIKSAQDIKRLVRLEVSTADQVTEEVEAMINFKDKNTGRKNIEGAEDGEIVIDGEKKTGDEVIKIIEEAPLVDQTKLDVQPEPSGGMQAFYTYIGNNLKFDDLDLVGMKVRVVLRFVIETNGKLTDVKIEDAGGFPELAERAVKLLQSERAPKWQPGVKNGMRVRTIYSIPIIADQR